MCSTLLNWDLRNQFKKRVALAYKPDDTVNSKKGFAKPSPSKMIKNISSANLYLLPTYMHRVTGEKHFKNQMVRGKNPTHRQLKSIEKANFLALNQKFNFPTTQFASKHVTNNNQFRVKINKEKHTVSRLVTSRILTSSTLWTQPEGITEDPICSGKIRKKKYQWKPTQGVVSRVLHMPVEEKWYFLSISFCPAICWI